MRILASAAVFVACLHGQTSSQWGGRATAELSNDLMQVTVLEDGASIVSMLLRDGGSQVNPLWSPPMRDTAGFGHFVCVDGFGPMSKEELAAGLPSHGEAIRTKFTVLRNELPAGVSLTLTATLPIVQERVIRYYSLRPGEKVIYVRTRVESLVGFDRPLVWAEHATIGSPFLERAVTAVDISGTRSQTRPWQGRGKHRLTAAKDFTWPMAPLADGGTVDLRMAPADSDSGDHSTTLMDPAREYAFATAVNTNKRLLIGWMWRTADYPWLQNWEHYPASGMLARGLEFSTQPYDISRRDAVALNGMFGAPTFRWLGAKSAVETSFAIFYTTVPEGFNRVKDARVEEGAIVLTGEAGQRVSLKASQPF